MSLLSDLKKRLDLRPGRSAADGTLPGSPAADHSCTQRQVGFDGGPGIQRHAFMAVVEALQDDQDTVPASTEIGRRLADDGVSLPEALDGLHAAYNQVNGSEPAFDAVRALSQSWSDTSLTYLHSLSCEDPLTGLASMSHLRSRLNDLYRDAERLGTSVSSTHALVVVEAPPIGRAHVDRELRLADIAECLRAVYAGGEVLARLGVVRGAALVARGPELPGQVNTVRGLIAWRGSTGEVDENPTPRVWIEGLPASVEWAGRLLDELAR